MRTDLFVIIEPIDAQQWIFNVWKRRLHESFPIMKLEHIFLGLGMLLSIITMTAVAIKMELSGFKFDAQTLGSIFFIIFPILPLALTTLMGFLFRKSVTALIICFVALLGAFGFLAFLFVQAFYTHPDPQGGLVLLFGPVYTLIGLLPFGIAALVFFLREQRKTS